MSYVKTKNREELERVAEYTGDLQLMAIFWSMFDDLSTANQKRYIKWAKNIVKSETGIDPDKQ